MESEKRFQVFISSTYLDLREARQEVVSTLLELGAFPAGMELFPAADDDAWQIISDIISDSDYYLLIIGGKYGSIDPVVNISFTEKEYDKAVELGKPVMAFIHGEPGKLPADSSELSDARRGKLEEFRSKVENAKHVKYWTTPSELGGQVAKTWHRFLKRYSAIGWIRGDQIASSNVMGSFYEQQQELRALREKLSEYDDLVTPTREDLAQGSDSITIELNVYQDGRFLGDSVSISTNWDELFTKIGLDLRKSPSGLGQLASGFTYSSLPKKLHTSVCRALVELHHRRNPGDLFVPKNAHPTGYEVDINTTQLEELLIQYEGLGLVKLIETNNDYGGIYQEYCITQLGRGYLLDLLAIKRTEPR